MQMVPDEGYHKKARWVFAMVSGMQMTLHEDIGLFDEPYFSPPFYAPLPACTGIAGAGTCPDDILPIRGASQISKCATMNPPPRSGVLLRCN
jgi:hypothetical protein